MNTLIALFCCIVTSAHAHEAVERTEFLSTKLRSCAFELDSVDATLEAIRNPADLTAALARYPHAQLILGSTDESYGLFIAVFPGRDESDESTGVPRMDFVVLNSMRAPRLTVHEAQLADSYLDAMLGGVLEQLNYARVGEDVYGRFRNTYRDAADGEINAVVKGRFYVVVTEASAKKIRPVVTHLVEWNQNVRAKLFP